MTLEQLLETYRKNAADWKETAKLNDGWRILQNKQLEVSAAWTHAADLLEATINAQPAENLALRNVAEAVIRHTETTKPHNGRGRVITYAANVDVIAQSARQLAEMTLDKLDGKPTPKINEDTPF